ncbi:MAG: phenylalanine--tRNA ligase subunit beta [Aquificaceae bacterium]|uniref:phenylalanine--tRNA ligase subunit beta n=1 Tax=Hydrogenobacter sp. Uz 6-8 TaxID=3384828 RepID=UPI00309522C6
MKFPFSWLSEFIDTEGLDPQRVAEELTLKSVEASLSRWDFDLDGVVFAKVVGKRPHPTKNLSVYRVKAGEELFFQVVSADHSLMVGDGVLLALPNAKVGSMCITERDFEGIISQGMLLSAEELGLEDSSRGVLVLDEDIKPGTSAYDLLGLGEYILEIEPTPNRGDLLSVKGLAREISAIMGVKKKKREYPEFEDSGNLDIRLESPDCRRYRGAVIEGLRVKPSPLWLRRRLWQCGIKTINNVVDITNYVMLLEGQPLHAFDLKRVNFPVVVRDAVEGESITTLMGSERELSPVNLLIADTDGPLALAGVVGGLESGVKEDTESILLESAYFDPYRIRKSAKSLNLQTDSSYRFERNVDIEGVKTAQNLAIKLVLELAGERLTALKDVYPEPYQPKRVFLSLEKFRRYSGRDFDRNFVSEALTALEIPHQVMRCGVEVHIPPHRSFDMQGDVDVIEELLRIGGYSEVGSPILREPSRPSQVESLEERLRSLMVSRGFTEVITFSFEDSELYELLSLPLPKVELVNPLNKTQRYMRTSLLPSLLRVCINNTRNYNYSMAIFELGKVFLEEEEPRLGFLMTGYRRLFPEEEYSPYDGLSLVQDVLRNYSENFTSEASALPFLHPGIQRVFYAGGREVGYFGLLSPALQDRLGIRHRVMVGEIRLSLLKERIRTYKPFAQYPPVLRDLTLLMDKGVSLDKLIFHIREKELVEDMKVFSLYTDPKFGEGKKSVSFRLVFRSREGTLSDQQVNRLVEEIVAELEEKFGAKLR